MSPSSNHIMTLLSFTTLVSQLLQILLSSMVKMSTLLKLFLTLVCDITKGNIWLNGFITILTTTLGYLNATYLTAKRKLLILGIPSLLRQNSDPEKLSLVLHSIAFTLFFLVLSYHQQYSLISFPNIFLLLRFSNRLADQNPFL